MTDDTDAPWYAVMTRAGMEGKADADLRRQGFTTFYPFERVRLRRKIPRQDKYLVTTVERPLFSRYLFVMLRHGQAMRAINDTASVSTVVYMAGAPLRIPPRVMDAIMAKADERGLVQERDESAAAPRRTLAKGTRVRFADNTPFAGLVAMVAADLGKSVKVVGAMFMGGCEINVDPVHIVPLAQPA